MVEWSISSLILEWSYPCFGGLVLNILSLVNGIFHFDFVILKEFVIIEKVEAI